VVNVYQRMVVGYHGCDRSVFERVLLGGEHLQPSQNRYDWLGKGIYFWEHGYQRALEFAEWKRGRGELTEPAVLGAYIHLGRCFDLGDTWASSRLVEHHTRLVAELEAAGAPIPINRRAGSRDFDLVLRDLDCAVLNHAMAVYDASVSTGMMFQTVRGVFVEGGPAFVGAGMHMKSHVQVAVRDVSCILGYFVPRAS
jgi:hypothetical protein